MSPVGSSITAEDLLALPDDGIERWIKDGRLRVDGPTIRNRSHSKTLSRIVFALESWVRQQASPRGEVLCGEAGVRLRRDPELTVGIHAVYIGQELASQTFAGTTIVDGVPVLAVEILSPSDKQDEVEEKIDDYLGAGVLQVWEVNPRRRTVTVYRPDREPEFFNVPQELVADPELPGFRVPLLALFGGCGGLTLLVHSLRE